MQQKEALFGKTLEQLRAVVLEIGLPKYTAAQICDWLYQKKCSSIEEMTNLSKKARASLSDKYDIGLRCTH